MSVRPNAIVTVQRSAITAAEAALPLSISLPTPQAYRPNADSMDEVFRHDGGVNAGYERVVEALLGRAPDQLASLGDAAERMLLHSGIFPFDVIPRVIDAATWQTLEAGLI